MNSLRVLQGLRVVVDSKPVFIQSAYLTRDQEQECKSGGFVERG
jgi:hypothetical protein